MEIKEKFGRDIIPEHNSNERTYLLEKLINDLKIKFEGQGRQVSPFIILIGIFLILLSKFICYFKYRNQLLYLRELNQPS